MTCIVLLWSNHRRGRSAPRPRKPQSPSACPTENVRASGSTGPTTVACVRTDGAARRGACAPCPWPLSARTASASRGRPCSSSRVNAATIAATSTKWPSPHSNGCTGTCTSSQTSTEEDFVLFFHCDEVNFLDEWRLFYDEGSFFPSGSQWVKNTGRLCFILNHKGHLNCDGVWQEWIVHVPTPVQTDMGPKSEPEALLDFLHYWTERWFKCAGFFLRPWGETLQEQQSTLFSTRTKEPELWRQRTNTSPATIASHWCWMTPCPTMHWQFTDKRNNLLRLCGKKMLRS